jgi:hypothetical protein
MSTSGRKQARLVSLTLAMQKVEGSSPFIRLRKSPANAGFFVRPPIAAAWWALTLVASAVGHPIGNRSEAEGRATEAALLL